MGHIYDLKTSNKSFLRMAKFLKDKNVKNYADHLILYDKDLVGVNPYDKNLTDEQKTRIYAELTLNPWYWFREVTRFADGTSEGIQFDLRIGSYMIVWSHIRNLNTFSVLSRQLGKTTSHLSWYAWLMIFGVRNQNIVFSLQDYGARKDVLAKWRWYIDSLPAWLKQLVTDYNDRNSTEEKSLSKSENKIISFGGSVNDDGADRSARGFSTSNLFMDEVAFFKSNSSFYEAALQATNTAIMSAKKNKTHYGIHFCTTPNRRDEGLPYGKWAYDMFNAGAPFRFEILDYSQEELIEYINNNSYSGAQPNGFLRLEFDWKISGMPQEWYDNAVRTSNNNTLKIRQELDLVWPQTDSGSVFDEGTMEILKKFSEREIAMTMRFKDNRFRMDFYEDMFPPATYIISVDTASGEGKDSTAIQIIDPIDYHIVASLSSPLISAPDLQDIIEELMNHWFKNAFLVIEAAPIGIPVIQHFQKNPLIAPRMFKEMVERTVTDKIDARGRNVTSTMKAWRYGVYTNIATRPLMMDLLRTIVQDTPNVITSPLVYNDIRNLTYNKGRIEAGSGQHDDNIMSYLITRWAVAYTPFFRNKKIIGGMLTKDILTEGVVNVHVEQKRRFASISGANGSQVRNISSLDYQKVNDDEDEQSEARKKRERFARMMM